MTSQTPSGTREKLAARDYPSLCNDLTTSSPCSLIGAPTVPLSFTARARTTSQPSRLLSGSTGPQTPLPRTQEAEMLIPEAQLSLRTITTRRGSHTPQCLTVPLMAAGGSPTARKDRGHHCRLREAESSLPGPVSSITCPTRVLPAAPESFVQALSPPSSPPSPPSSP